MACAIDTNVILDLVIGDRTSSGAAAELLEREGRMGALVICPPVYAECLAHPSWKRSDLDHLLAETKIGVDWDLGAPIWVAAAEAFSKYARRRRQLRDHPRRILADFIIGAHAAERGITLLTRDLFYSAYFPALRILSP